MPDQPTGPERRNDDACPQKLSRFRVTFIGGAEVEVTAPNATRAEQMARRSTPGVLAKITFMGRAEQ